MHLILADLGIVSALGCGKAATWYSLLADPQRCLSQQADWIADKIVCVGQVTTPLASLANWPMAYHSRANQLALCAFEQISEQVEAAIGQYGAHRIGVVIGTSTSGTLEAEQAFAYVKDHQHQHQHQPMPDTYHYQQQEMGSPAAFIAQVAGIHGLSFCISTACSSGAKALISASQLINSGIVDAVICGGVDSLCRLTLNGFDALESLSPTMCNPLSRNRNGINIGEGAGLFLMKKGQSGVALSGFGESSDAYHMSAPHPEGDGAFSAMTKALKSAAIPVTALDYINLHGTATLKNDEMEANAIERLGAQKVPCSSTKPYTGHTLAGAGAIEAGICWLSMSRYNTTLQLPVHHFDGQYDDSLRPLTLVTDSDSHHQPINHCLSNSFAFGGSNASLLLSRISG